MEDAVVIRMGHTAFSIWDKTSIGWFFVLLEFIMTKCYVYVDLIY